MAECRDVSRFVQTYTWRVDVGVSCMVGSCLQCSNAATAGEDWRPTTNDDDNDDDRERRRPTTSDRPNRRHTDVAPHEHKVHNWTSSTVHPWSTHSQTVRQTVSEQSWAMSCSLMYCYKLPFSNVLISVKAKVINGMLLLNHIGLEYTRR